jgi:hypothetical protein
MRPASLAGCIVAWLSLELLFDPSQEVELLSVTARQNCMVARATALTGCWQEK